MIQMHALYVFLVMAGLLVAIFIYVASSTRHARDIDSHAAYGIRTKFFLVLLGVLVVGLGLTLGKTPYPKAFLREVVQEMRGKFVASYAMAGKVAFRCFEYDPQSGRYSLDWGVLLMLLPAAGGIVATIWAFFLSRHRRPSRVIIRYVWPFPRVSPSYRNEGLVPPKPRTHSAKSNLGVMHATTTESSDVGLRYRVRVRLSKS